jgi:hypothetical protein
LVFTVTLLAKYNKKELNSFAKDLDLGGGNFRALTEPEGKFILEQIQRGETLDSIRDRILESREEKARRVLPETLQGKPDSNRYNRPLNYIDPSEVTVPFDPETGEPVLDTPNTPDTLFSASKRNLLEEAAGFDTWQGWRDFVIYMNGGDVGEFNAELERRQGYGGDLFPRYYQG